MTLTLTAIVVSLTFVVLTLPSIVHLVLVSEDVLGVETAEEEKRRQVPSSPSSTVFLVPPHITVIPSYFINRCTIITIIHRHTCLISH
jgi:hypothetical protein